MRIKSLLIGLAFVAAATWLSQSAAADDKTAHEDELMIAAQKICPVSGEAPRSNGHAGQNKSRRSNRLPLLQGVRRQRALEGKSAEGDRQSDRGPRHMPCARQSAAERCSLDSSQQSRNFRLLQECIAKIKADPDKYIAKVDEQIEKNLREQQVKKL